MLSLALSLGGLLAFGLHTYFIRKGGREFTTPVSQAVLWSILATSLIQAAWTVRALLSM